MSRPGSENAMQRFRVLYVNPLQLGLIQLVVVVVAYLVLCALALRSWSALQLGISALAGFASGVVVAILFDLVAPIVGGLKIEVVADEPAPLPMAVASMPADGPADLLQAVPDPGTRKQCPQCGANIRSDRSFCPECDFTFDAPE